MIKNKFKIFLLILSLIIAFSLTLFTNSLFFESKVVNLQDTTKELRVSGPEINITTPENITYTEPMSGYYPSTYGFENDEVDSVPLGWTDESGGTSSIKIVTSEDGHNKVLELKEGSSGDPYAVNAIDNVENGTVEFWMKIADMTERVYFSPAYLDERTTQLFRVVLYDNKAGITALGDVSHEFGPAAADTWHHFSVDYECGTGGYKGLGQYEVNVTYNGVRYGPYSFWNNAPYADRLAFAGFNGENDYYYVDAVGYSWDPSYTIGDNLNEGLLLSYENTTTLDWQGYSLDGQTNKTIMGNITIPFLTNDGIHSIQVFGNNSLGTMYQSDMRYFTIKQNFIDIITPENITYTEPMSGYYPATYGFENDEVNSVPLGWTDESGGTCSIKIIASEDGHNKVLELKEGSSGDPYAVNAIDNIESGTVEFWMKIADMTERVYFSPAYLDERTTQLFRVVLYDNKAGITAFGDVTHDFGPAAADTWHHFSVDYECGTGGYKGLGQYEVNVTYNGVRYGPYNFWNNAPYTDRLAFAGFNGDNDYYYVDAVGYSWDPGYTIGDNLKEGLLLSYENTTTLDWQGYSLDGQTNKTILGNTTIPMPEDGVHTVQVFGNNSLGTMYQSQIRYFEIDTNPPVIQINVPDSNQFFGITTPTYEISITESNLDTTWYSLNNGITNITFSGLTGTINQTLWNNIINSDVLIIFYANDTWGFESYNTVTVRKETVAPISLISYTSYGGMNFVNTSTTFTINADDGTGSGVSIIRYKINDPTWIEYTGPFDLSSYTHGEYNITYYSIDNVGNVEDEKSIIVRLVEIPSESPGIPGYHLLITLCSISIISLIIIKKRSKL